MSSSSSITFYGGVHEIGGNKFLVEDKGTKIGDVTSLGIPLTASMTAGFTIGLMKA